MECIEGFWGMCAGKIFRIQNFWTSCHFWYPIEATWEIYVDKILRTFLKKIATCLKNKIYFR